MGFYRHSKSSSWSHRDKSDGVYESPFEGIGFCYVTIRRKAISEPEGRSSVIQYLLSSYLIATCLLFRFIASLLIETKHYQLLIASNKT